MLIYPRARDWESKWMKPRSVIISFRKKNITEMNQHTERKRQHRKTVPTGASQHVTAGPYSPVLVVDPGKLVVLSGQAAIDPDGRIVGEEIKEQTRYMMENCRNLLARAGCTMDDVFKATVYLKNIEDW